MAVRRRPSPGRDVRSNGIFAAKRMGADASALMGALRALGDRIAIDGSMDARVELDLVREALTKLGCAAEDLPRPPSRFQGYLGFTPRERGKLGPYVLCEIVKVVQHGHVGVPTGSLGLWNDETGRLMFVIEGAQLMAAVKESEEILVIRTGLRADAKFGGTSRADLAWTLDRHALPSGQCIASLAIPERLTVGWPSDLSIGANIATVRCGDERGSYSFRVSLEGSGRILE